MIRKTKSLSIIILVLYFMLTFTACGSEAVEQSSAGASTAEPSSSLTLQDIQTPGGVADMDKVYEYMGLDVDKLETSFEKIEDVPENVILLAAVGRDYMQISDAVEAFNAAQSEYKVEVKRYKKRDEYFALMDLHPEIPVGQYVNTKEFNSWFVNDLVRVPEMFVNWDTRTCSFDRSEFISLLEKIRKHAFQFPELTSVMYPMPMDYLLYENKIQVMNVGFGAHQFNTYLSIRDAFLDDYDLVGYPNANGEPEFMLSNINAIYSMNAASAKKDAVWSFFEYILSAEFQESMLDEYDDYFPARRDVVVQCLDKKIEAVANAAAEGSEYSYRNSYLESKISNYTFTEEDKERILYVLDHVSGDGSMLYEGEMMSIFIEEMGAFAAGDKSAEETARNIQNRMSIYLME